MHEPPLPRRQPPSLGTSHATPIRNIPADGSSENEGKFGALAPGEGRAPPTNKRPTATNRLHQFSALFGWADLALSLHLMLCPAFPCAKRWSRMLPPTTTPERPLCWRDGANESGTWNKNRSCTGILQRLWPSHMLTCSGPCPKAGCWMPSHSSGSSLSC